MTRYTAAAAATTLALTAAVAITQAQTRRADTPPRDTPPILTESLAGRDSFELYCAPCHGSNGRGNGPVASALRTSPPDLTQLTRRNGGVFPRDRVSGFVTGTGRALPSHGSAEMPVWGPTFRAFESDVRVRERIGNLITHIEGMQQASSGVASDGAQLFRTYCASCHGATAVGNGPVAERLRERPPDLTQFTARNGGVFPSERLSRIIDGRGVLPTHGDRDMPVWGDAFRASRGGLSAAEVSARIAAIVRYLESIQQRNAE